MVKFLCRRFRVFSFALLLLVVGLPFLVGTPPPTHAADLRERVACWTSGPPDGASSPLLRDTLTGKAGFGSPFAFAVDPEDLQGYAATRSGVEVLEDARQHSVKRRIALFSDAPDLVDHAFFLPSDPGHALYDKLYDTQAEHQQKLLAGTLSALEQGELELPWDTSVGFLESRAVARFDEDRVTSYFSRWYSPEESEGGLTTDMGALARDDHANAIERASGTMEFAEHGFRTILGVHEVASTEVELTLDLDCAAGVCTEKLATISRTVPTVLHTSEVDASFGEEYNTQVGADVRPYAPPGPLGTPGPVVEREVHNEYVAPSSLDDRLKGTAAYAEVGQRDTDNNKLHVEIELARVYRGDYLFQMGRSLGKVELPGLGPSVWTYNKVKDGREARLNRVGPVVPPALGTAYLVRDSTHMGFRQPVLDGVYPTLGSKPQPEAVSEILWPANLEDLNWFLYDLPGTELDDPWSLLWIDDEGSRWLVESGYGVTGVPYGPTAAMPDCELTGAALRVEAIECVRPSALDWDSDAVQKGRGSLVYLPFETQVTGDSNRLDASGSLVMKGVASPVDAGPNPGRNMNKFAFVIEEGSKFGPDVDLQATRGLDRFGGPRRRGAVTDPDTYEQFVEAWPAGSIDPNQSYLLVVTFYEAYHPHRWGVKGSRHLEVSYETAAGETVILPKRTLRRVVCRMVVYPSGIEPAVNEHRSWWSKLFDQVGTELGRVWYSFKALAADTARGLVTLPLMGIREGAGLACQGLGHLDALTDIVPPGAEVYETVHTADGRLVANAAVKSKREGSEHCYRIAAPTVGICEAGTDLIVKGYCTNLPELELVARKYQFVDPIVTHSIPYEEFSVSYLDFTAEPTPENMVSVAISTQFDPVVRDAGDPGGPYTSGLTAVRIEWPYRWRGVVPDVEKAIDGYMVRITPDSKSAQYLKPGEYAEFPLPRFILVKTTKDVYSSPGSVGTPGGLVASGVGDEYVVDLNGFWLGALDEHPSSAGLGNSLVDRPAHADHEVLTGFLPTPLAGFEFVDDFRNFQAFVDGLPLAPGFQHKVSVAAFHGIPGEDLIVGNFSEELTVNGDQAACSALSEGAVPGADLQAKVNELYGCGNPDHAVAFTAFEDHRIGLLELSGTSICGDIFSSTPAVLTWDNEVVKRVWGLMWILAGGVLFSLLVWQGVRMTYDTWIDPQPAVGLRELVPRFLLAITLAAGSLVLARLVLVLSSDVTCFVAQMTGMSMWGVIGVTFGAIMDGVTAWIDKTNADVATFLLHDILLRGLIILALSIVILVFVFVLLFLFVKVALGMLLRIAMLGVLIAVAPVAFALYASDTTSGWTSWWVKAFLGAACQQVFVLVVIYLGAHMVGTYMEAAVEGELQVMVIGLMLALLTLALADTVPKIVNPEGSKAMAGTGQALGMAGMAAMVVAAGGVGGVAGLAAGFGRGVMGGGGSSTSTNMRLPVNQGGPDADGGPQGGSAVPTGGGPQGGPQGGPSSFQGLQARGLSTGSPGAPGFSQGGVSPGGGQPGAVSQSGGATPGASSGGNIGGVAAGAAAGTVAGAAAQRGGEAREGGRSVAGAGDDGGRPSGGVVAPAGGVAPSGGQADSGGGAPAGGDTAPGGRGGGAQVPGGATSPAGQSPGGAGPGAASGEAPEASNPPVRPVGAPAPEPSGTGRDSGADGAPDGGGVVMRQPSGGGTPAPASGGGAPSGQTPSGGVEAGGGRSSDRSGVSAEPPRPLTLGGRLGSGLRGAVSGGISGAQTGARFGGRVNERIDTAMRGRMFLAGPGRQADARPEAGGYASASEQSSREMRETIRRVARSIDRRRRS